MTFSFDGPFIERTAEWLVAFIGPFFFGKKLGLPWRQAIHARCLG